MTSADSNLKRRHEAPELGGAAKRMMRALARRACEGDTEALEQLESLQEEVQVHMHNAVMGLRRKGHSWAYIAGVLGVSRQAAQQRFVVRGRL